MRNRAKCKLCKSVIESFSYEDYVGCECGEIAISGGEYKFQTFAKDYKNFLRVNDQEKESEVTLKDDKDVNPLYMDGKVTKKVLIDMLDEMQKNIEKLPYGALSSPISHSDFSAFISLVSSIFKCDCKEEI